MVSIIIPVYNVEKYLQKCIESIRCQTYTEWECILVDDGSTDNSRKICDDYCNLDSRFKTYHIYNQGVGNARNLGIEKSNGEWLVFVDSDDSISSDYLESLLKAAHQYDTDLVITSFCTIRESNGETIYHKYEEEYCTRENMGSAFLKYPPQFFYSACYKLFKAHIVASFNIRFATDISLGEDFLFSTLYLSKISSLIFINGGLYCYLWHSKGSLTFRNRNLTEIQLFHNQLTNLFITGIENKFSQKMDYFFGMELVYSLECLIQNIDKIPNKRDKKNFLKTLDIHYYHKYKKCLSWKEWILKQSLVYHLPNLFFLIRKYSYTKSFSSILKN